jgi:hypothetical protein
MRKFRAGRESPRNSSTMGDAAVTDYEWAQLFLHGDLFCHETMEKWWFMPRDELPAPPMPAPPMHAPTLEEFLDREELMQLLLEIEKQVASAGG